MTVVNSFDPELNGENFLNLRILNSCTSRWVSSPCGGGKEEGRDLRGRLRLLHGWRRVLLRCVTPRICPVSGLSVLVCHPFFRGEIGGWINFCIDMIKVLQFIHWYALCKYVCRLASCPTQPNCIAHFDLCICQLYFMTNDEKAERNTTAQLHTYWCRQVSNLKNCR